MKPPNNSMVFRFFEKDLDTLLRFLPPCLSWFVFFPVGALFICKSDTSIVRKRRRNKLRENGRWEGIVVRCEPRVEGVRARDRGILHLPCTKVYLKEMVVEDSNQKRER